MPKVKIAYYAVRKGRIPGIYPSWEECEAQVKGFHGAAYKKLNTEREARAFIAGESPSKPPSSGLFPSTISPAVTSTSVSSTLSNSVALHPLPAVCLEEDGYGCDIVYCDGFESWLPKWSVNGFRTANGEPVKNAALIRYLAALLYARERAGPKVRFKHVRGHVGIEGNECADRLANEGALKPELLERDWERLIRDVESTSTRVTTGIANHVKSSTAAPRPITSTSASSGSTRLPQPSSTTHLPSPSREAATQQATFTKAELDDYASCLLDTNDLESDDLESDF
ncbi:hypothetical protein AZE42_10613 [Rhizopogon vesiculosus]|uniref:Ribonuclease H n=1 Tax=Rhizopogon vesiculosus TaxID=180088 RepID=A0A1J8QLL2_9AGAM|nr:hypothetical protein AZE42_10613 [Rhizopogon vesiculosus]